MLHQINGWRESVIQRRESAWSAFTILGDDMARLKEVETDVAAERIEVLTALFESFGFELDVRDRGRAEEVRHIVGCLLADVLTIARRYGWSPRRRPISSRVRTLVYRRDAYACCECGADDIAQLTLDHRVPVALGGGNDPDNLRTLCRRCNSLKGTKL